MPPEQSRSTRRSIYVRDEFGKYSALTFNIGQLPLEVQEMIIVKAAVARRLTSETWGEVFEALGPVCKLWLDRMKNPVLYETIKRETFAKDPLCRYLRTAQPIRVSGVETTHISSVVTLGDRVYVSEVVELLRVSRIFVYDLDVSAIREINKKKRVVTCSNRQPLALNGLHVKYSVNTIVACARTNTLYVREYHFVEDDNVWKWTVVKVKPDDGTVLVKWTTDLLGTHVQAMALSVSGDYMVMTSLSYEHYYTFVYCTSTGAIVNRINSTSLKMWPNAAFLAVTLSDDSLMDFVELTSSIKTIRYASVAHTFVELDDGVLMKVDQNNFSFIDPRTNRSRNLSVTTSMTNEAHMFAHSWYDKAHGLIFVSFGNRLNVFRVTY